MADLREILIIALALLTGFCLLRAVYAIYRRRKGQIRLSIDKDFAQSVEGLEEAELAELPNGGARAIPGNEAEDAGSRQSASDGALEADDPAAERDVPLLLDPVAVAPADEVLSEPRELQRQSQGRRKKKSKEKIHESSGISGSRRKQSSFEMDLDTVSMTAGERIGGDSRKRSSEKPSEPLTRQARSIETARAKSQPEPESAIRESGTDIEKPDPDVAAPSAQSDQQVGAAATSVATGSADISADRIIVINVFASETREFAGRELWDFLHAAGLRHDKMKILSKTEGNLEDGRAIFRVANIVNPGTFDAAAIDRFTTPGISMFMLLPAPINNLLAFEQMLAVARRLAEALDGQLLDANRQELTAKSIEQARRRIRDFDRNFSSESSVSSQI